MPFMKKNCTILFIVSLLLVLVANGYSQKVFRSTGSGNYNAYTTWEISTNGPNGGFTGAPAPTGSSAVAGVNYPDTSADVIVQGGHTVKLTSTQNLKNLTINAGGALISDGTARTLRPYHALGLTITNNGMLGGLTTGPDAIVLEVYGADTSSHGFTLTGNGVTQINRIRMAGGLPNLTVVIDQNVTLTQSANYALTAVYNPTTVDNYTLTINSGKTVTLLAGSGYFHNGTNSATPAGNYTYNINGTLDLSNTTGNVNLIPLGSSSSVLTLNVNGILKLGSGNFSSDTSNGGGTTTFGKVSLNINNGGLVDATAAKTSFKTGVELGQYFILSGTGTLKRSVASTATLFPVGTSSTSYSPVTLTNTGIADNFSVTLKNTFTNTPPNITKVVNKQWSIIEQATGAIANASFGWVSADQASAFNPAGTVNIMNYAGSAWTNYGLNGALTGTGTITDPYIAACGNNFTTFGDFGVTNGTALPVIFSDISAVKSQTTINISWTVGTEVNTNKYIVEKSTDAKNFSAIGSVDAINLGKYSYIDMSVSTANNYYRIKAVDKDGSFAYSSVVFTISDSKVATVTVYPNPVINKQVNVQLSNLVTGSYNVEVYNNLGQAVLSKFIQLDGANTSLTLQLPSSVSAGLYRLSVSDGATKINKTISIQ